MTYEIVKNESDKIEFLLEGEVLSSSDFEFLDTCLSVKKAAVLDMSGISYVNSSGFGAMVEESMNFRDSGLTLSFYNLEEAIRETLNLLGAEDLLAFLD